jgi:hypothetical protein
MKALCYGFKTPQTYNIEQNKGNILKWIATKYTARQQQKERKKHIVFEYADKLEKGESIIIRNKKWNCEQYERHKQISQA